MSAANRIPVQRIPLQIDADRSRVIARFFFNGKERAQKLTQCIIKMSEAEATGKLHETLREFNQRHRNISDVFLNNFHHVTQMLKWTEEQKTNFSRYKKILLGSYFTHEYSIEAAAFFNPSLIISPDQSNLEEGELRAIASLRATGEGHISSIEFRNVVVGRNNSVRLEEVGQRLESPKIVQNHVYQKEQFGKKMQEMKDILEFTPIVLNKLPAEFDYRQLRQAVQSTINEVESARPHRSEIQEILWLADSHYTLRFSMDTDISERVIFPVSDWENKGIEDARFVRFVADNDEVTFYATYTAYDGRAILPKLVETKDFFNFKIKPLYGNGAQNKNLALFPRQVNGKYVMLARIDGVNNYIMFSDSLNVWESPQLLHEPKYPWELVQVGNCGSPLETEHGWLLITHGVGPMRRYCLGAILLDLDDPATVIGRLEEPLLVPNEMEREGYVPNVVYSCGSLINNGELLIPYAMSDYASTFATVNMELLLEKLLASQTALAEDSLSGL